ncbi:MAG: DNA mismatch repair protein MutS, partial [Candidatus Cloacimonetes bacterium]|nr:DNA mismatch repair protein MutS [Candidatus Cloacimonadota bacterium]
MSKRKDTPMLRQYMDIKEQHPDKLLLFRMGDFYETFFDDAVEASRRLGITLTARDKKKDNPVPLAGFPYRQLENYLNKLIRQGCKVVVCDQVEDPKLSKGLVKRAITDIVTPGAILGDSLLDTADNNFLCALCPDAESGRTGLASIDISTGDFTYTEPDDGHLNAELQRLHPAEIVAPDTETLARVNKLHLEHEPAVTLFEGWRFDSVEAERLLSKQFGAAAIEGLGFASRPAGTLACGMLLTYLHSLKKDDLSHVTEVHYYSMSDFMQIDEVTSRNLELTRNMRNGARKASLLGVIDRTSTPMGARLLQRWLLQPLLDSRLIEARLNAVATLRGAMHLTDDLRTLLATIGDMSRILSKVAALRANPRDLVALAGYLDLAPHVARLLADFDCPMLAQWRDAIDDYSGITASILTTLVDEPPTTITDGGLVRNGNHDELDELRAISREGKGGIARMEQRERERTGIGSLKVGYNKVFGYYIEVTHAHRDKVPDDFIRKQTLVGSERFVSPELKEYESKVLGAEERIKSLEYELFCQLRERLQLEVAHMQSFVEVVAGLDVVCGLAQLAYDENYCRPFLSLEGVMEIRESRHPVVEKLLEGEKFIPNDIVLGEEAGTIALITGPNMAGKSTYLRQAGLIAILAQMGSFVPAASAILPVFDKVFTRVGASDNLAMGQSTFLVEMLETANILAGATTQSLILLDEIGRGTSTFDGLSLAWAIVEYIHNTNRLGSRTMFATHYHELTELENVLPGVKNYSIAVREWNDEMIFVRKIERGGADQSYGIQVARLAGVPNRVIRRARQILANLEEHE